MNKEWQRYLDLASGLRDATQKRAEQVVRTLVKQGEIATDRAEKAVDELLSRSEANRKAIASVVRSETEKAVERLGLVRQKDLRALERKVEKLERASGGSSSAIKKSTKKAATRPVEKNAPPLKASKKATKKSAAAKRAARSTAAKKTQERARPPKKTAPPASPTSEIP